MPFIVYIETIGNIILAVRLEANISAGRGLLTLLGNTGLSLPFTILSYKYVSPITVCLF